MVDIFRITSPHPVPAVFNFITCWMSGTTFIHYPHRCIYFYLHPYSLASPFSPFPVPNPFPFPLPVLSISLLLSGSQVISLSFFLSMHLLLCRSASLYSLSLFHSFSLSLSLSMLRFRSFSISLSWSLLLFHSFSLSMSLLISRSFSLYVSPHLALSFSPRFFHISMLPCAFFLLLFVILVHLPISTPISFHVPLQLPLFPISITGFMTMASTPISTIPTILSATLPHSIPFLRILIRTRSIKNDHRIPNRGHRQGRRGGDILRLMLPSPHLRLVFYCCDGFGGGGSSGGGGGACGASSSSASSPEEWRCICRDSWESVATRGASLKIWG